MGGCALLHAAPRRLLQRSVPSPELAELHGARQGALDFHEPGRRAPARATIHHPRGWRFLEKSTLNIVNDHMLFDYHDFRDPFATPA